MAIVAGSMQAKPPSKAEPASWATTPAIRASMQSNRSRDTAPEIALRSEVHRLGLRFRVATRPVRPLRRTADLVFPRARVAVFLDGCYWHGCSEHHRQPTLNSDYWSAKVQRNRERDAATDKSLAAAGWYVIRVWEHEDPRTAARRIAAMVRGVAIDVAVFAGTAGWGSSGERSPGAGLGQGERDRARAGAPAVDPACGGGGAGRRRLAN